MSGRDWQNVPIPERLERRPKDGRGFPISFVTYVDPHTGKPDFTVVDGESVMICCRKNLCGLCGQEFDQPPLVFIGGPLSIKNGAFLDPPMHPECAEYAAKVCPHLAISTSRYSKDAGPPGTFRHPGLSLERPDRFGLYYCRNATACIDNETIFFTANEPTKIVWLEEDQ